MRIGELFAGIGGFGLGLERALPGSSVVWQIEKNPFCRQVLANHWPNAKRFSDVRQITFPRRELDPVDIIAAGFPCQGASLAGNRKGLSDNRTALWWHVVRICSAIRPRYICLENVSALLTVSGGQDFGTILGSLDRIGYDASWRVLSASEFGAPHRRKRLFVVASDTDSCSQYAMPVHAEASSTPESSLLRYWDYSESPLVGMANGLPHRMDRNRALGNAIVPQCSQYLGGYL